jgi:hypothetical protein
LAFIETLIPAVHSNLLFFKEKNKRIFPSIGARLNQLAFFKHFISIQILSAESAEINKIFVQPKFKI